MIRNILCRIFKLTPISKYDELQETLNVRIADLQRMIDKDALIYKTSKKKLCNEIDLLRQENEALQSNLFSANEQIAELHTEIADYKQQINNLESALQKHKSMLEAALEDKTKLKNENSELLTNLKSKCAIIEELESSIDNYKSLLEESAELLKEKENVIITNNSKYDNIITTLKATEKDITLENETYKLQVKNLQDKCEGYRVKNDFYSTQASKVVRQTEKIKELESDLFQRTQELNNLKDTNTQLQHSLDNLQSSNIQLKKELDDSQNSNKQLIGQVKHADQLFFENDSLRKDLNKYHTLVKESESKIQTCERELKKTTDALNLERQVNKQKIENLNYSLDKIKTGLLEKIKDKDNIIENQKYAIQDAKKINNELEFDKKQLLEELHEVKKKNTHPVQASDLKSKNNPKKYTLHTTKYKSNTPIEKYSEPKKLILTQSVDIIKVAHKTGAYKEVLQQSSKKEYINPEIQNIIEKLAKIKIEVLYKGGIFYFRSKKRGIEKLFIQHFEEYNEQILLLYDGKHYCGYDMGTGIKASNIHKKRNLALAELDTYYEENYCK